MMEILLTIAGLALILVGANYLTDGSAALARRFHISEFIVGLTVVAIGTSTPELIVSVMSAIHGSGEMAIGNVTGSNVFNGLFILGISALIAPVPLTGNNIKKDIPFGVLASVILLVVCCDGLSVATRQTTSAATKASFCFCSSSSSSAIRYSRHRDRRPKPPPNSNPPPKGQPRCGSPS